MTNSKRSRSASSSKWCPIAAYVWSGIPGPLSGAPFLRFVCLTGLDYYSVYLSLIMLNTFLSGVSFMSGLILAEATGYYVLANSGLFVYMVISRVFSGDEHFLISFLILRLYSFLTIYYLCLLLDHWLFFDYCH